MGLQLSVLGPGYALPLVLPDTWVQETGQEKKRTGKGRFGSQGDTKPWFHSWVTVPYPFLLTGPSVGQRPQHDRDPHTLLRSISNTVLCSQGPEAQRRDHRVIPSTRKALEEAWGAAHGLSRAPQLCGDLPTKVQPAHLLS